METAWIRLGCFLTGYNYTILKSCSETAAKRVKSYTSAMLIICILWSFIGYTFAERYLRSEWYFSLLGAFIMLVIVIQIERQVILSPKGNRAPKIVRLVIAAAMATIGSVIIDQIIFKEDINQQKVVMMSEKIKRIFPSRAEELRRQIREIDSTILNKEQERRELANDVSKTPTIHVYSSQITREDSTERRIFNKSSIPNPKFTMLQPIDNQISALRVVKIKKDSMLLSLRPIVEAELKENVGFLDELQLMISIFSESTVAFSVWLLWFIFLLGIETFILVTKWREHDTDYDAILHQQMEIHLRKIQLLNKQYLGSGDSRVTQNYQQETVSENQEDKIPVQGS